jgi:hypothetical protein
MGIVGSKLSVHPAQVENTVNLANQMARGTTVLSKSNE